MIEEKYKVKSRRTICPHCQSFCKETGEIFPPKKYDDENLECTNPDCGDVFSIVPMFEFSYCCPSCGFECPVEDECYQVEDNGSWNIFPYEVLDYVPVDEHESDDPKKMKFDMVYNLDVKTNERVKKPIPEGLESFMVIHGRPVYPKYEDEYRGWEGDRNWTEVHYCPHCKEEYSFWNGS